MAVVSLSSKRTSYFEHKVAELFAGAGITINGSQSYDIQVHDQRFFRRVLMEGSLGLGESYMEGWWDCNRLDVFFAQILSRHLENNSPVNVIVKLAANLFNPQSVKRALHNASFHYDLGNDLFIAMLDKRLTYTCGYWKEAATLDEAQEAKLDLVCRKLNLRPGMDVLDIGCGWGSFAAYAAQKYDVHVTGITLSKEQLELGKKLCHGLPVELKLMDYRDLTGKFDRIVSLGMFEHVGYKNLRTYFEVVDNCLTRDGITLLHTIGSNNASDNSDSWLSKYIFPNAFIPSIMHIEAAAEGLFIMEDLHNFGIYYDKTLMAWYRNFTFAWPALKDRYGDFFYRMWTYYLQCCAGSFRARKNQLWQIVFSKGLQQGYTSIR